MNTGKPSAVAANETPAAPARSGLDFLVVGIGASAGGLPALLRLFSALPPEHGMAFVVVLHLSPEHESSAADILQRATPMPVHQVTERLPIEPGHVYVIVLIYLNREAQLRVLEKFHAALNPDGFLFLGSSESADAASELFVPFDKKTASTAPAPCRGRRATCPPCPAPCRTGCRSRRWPASRRARSFRTARCTSAR